MPRDISPCPLRKHIPPPPYYVAEAILELPLHLPTSMEFPPPSLAASAVSQIMADTTFHDLEYTYQAFYPSPAPLFSPYPPRSSTPLDLPREYRPVFPVLRDLTDGELLNITDLVLFERQRQHIETLREKVRYVDRLTAFLEQEGKFGVGDLFTEQLQDEGQEVEEAVLETSENNSYKGKGRERDVDGPELGNGGSPCVVENSYHVDTLPLPVSYGAFPNPPPSIISFYQPLYTPHQAGGAKYSPRTLNDPMKSLHAMYEPATSLPKQPLTNGKGKGKAKVNGNSKRKNKQADPELEKRWVSYCQSRFRYQWEMAQADSEISVLEAAVEVVLQRKRGEITGGGGLRRETLGEVTRLRNLRMGGQKAGSSSMQTGLATPKKRPEGPITKLPTELLHQIFSYFRSPHLASTHALVSRRWNCIATPIIYKKIPFGDYMEDYWVEVGRRKRMWRKKQEQKEKCNGKEKGYDLPKVYEPSYGHGHRISRISGAGWPTRYGLRHDCQSEYEEDEDLGFKVNDEEDFYPDGKQGSMFPIGGPALVVMPWSMGIIRAIGNPHLAKHVRQIDYQASSYTAFPNHNEAGKVFSDLTDMRPMLDQRFRTLEKLLQHVRKAVRACARVESLKLNSGDERIANALLGLLKWSPKIESLSIINTNLRLLQFSRGPGKGQEGLISRGDGKGKGKARPREGDEASTAEDGLGFRQYLLDSQNLSEPQKNGLRIKVKAKGPPDDDFYIPSIKRVLLFRCGYHPQSQKDTGLIEPPVRVPTARTTDRAQASRDRERRRRRRIKFRAKIARGEKRALEKVVFFLQRCKNLEELKVKGCQFLPEALVDSSIIWEVPEDEAGTIEECPLTLNKLSSVTIRSCGTYLHDRTPEIWLSSTPFESFFLRHKVIKHLGWNGWILNRHLPLEDTVFSRVATHLGRTVTSLSIAHGYDEEVARTAPESLHRVRLSLKRFNLLLRHLRQLDTLEWRMFYLPVGKMMMGIRNLRRCPKMKNLRIEGVIGVISQDEARELVTSLPLLEKLRIGWRPRPVGYRRGRGGPALGSLHQPPIWGDEIVMEYESSPSPPLISPPIPPPVPSPQPPALMDSDFEDGDWGGEMGREPEWVAAEEVARIFADAKHLKDLMINILISMPASVEKHVTSMELRVADEILRPASRDGVVTGGTNMASQLRKSWLEKIRETAIAFARNPPSSVKKVGMGYFIGVQGLTTTVALERNSEGEVVGWSADLRGGRKVGENWREGVEVGVVNGGERWLDGAFKEAKEREIWTETTNWRGGRVCGRGYNRQLG